MERHILHADQDTFFVSVARKENAALHHRPVLIGGLSDRAVVASCSYEARQAGVHNGMAMRLARQLCPEAIIVKSDFDRYSYYSRLITGIIAARVPLYEKTSIDEHYIDLTGMDRYFGCARFAHELRQEIIRETGLPISMGLSVNKTVSKVATGQAKPNGELSVQRGSERLFLAPLSIRKLPGVGAKKYQLLRTMGIDRIQTIQEMPRELLARTLGKEGNSLWQKANGLDDAPVVPYREQKSMSKEQTFEQDTIDMELLRKTIRSMVSELAFELRSEGKIAGTITVKIRYSDFQTYDRQATLPYTHLDSVLIPAALEVFQKLYTRRVLVRLIGVKLSNLVHGSPQIDLFQATEEQTGLHQAMDSIRKRFGFQFLKVAAVL